MAELPILDPIHFVTDLEGATDFERKHTPHIELVEAEGKTKITVDVGFYVAHPNEPDHFFNFIEILVNEVPVAHFDGAPGLVAPHIEIIAALERGCTVTALASCNLHGVWKAETKLA